MAWQTVSDLIRYKVGDVGGQRSISLAGELDLLSAQRVRRLLNRDLAAGTLNILDLSRLTFVDAAGISALLHAARRVRVIKGELVLRPPSPALQRLLALSGLERILVVEPSRWEQPSSDVTAILGEAVEGAMRISGATAGNAQVVGSSGSLHLVAHQGFDREFLAFFDVVTDEESACGKALATGGSVWVGDVADSAIFRGTPSMDVVLDAGVRAVASLPVHAPGGSLMAVISIHHAEPTEWSSEQISRLHEHARAAAQLIAAQLA